MKKQVFYDPLQARWRRIRRVVDAAALAFSLLVVFFIYSALRSEPLPDLSWLSEKKPYHALKENEKAKAREKRRLATLARAGHRHQSRKAPSQLKLNSEQGVRAAFYVSWDAASFSSLREYARQIDLLFPTWLQVLGADGHLQASDPETNAMFDVVQGQTVRHIDDKVMQFLKAENTDMEVFPVVQNFDGTDFVPSISDFLNNPVARANFRRQIGIYLASDHYRGLMVDFESFPKKGQPGYVALLNELSSDLHAKGMKLYVSVQVRNQDYDYKAIASAVDGVVIMNYDEHFPGGTPGPVASQDWFTDNLDSAVEEIPKEKLICAIGNYGYDWFERPKTKKDKLPPGEADKSVSVQEAWIGARDSEEDVDFDDDALNPHFSYRDDDNVRHDVWFLDAVTALNQMRAAQTLGIQTFALWRLGAEDRSLWRVWDMPGEANASDRLKDVPPGQDVDMEGSGEILHIEARPTDGERELSIDKQTGLIDGETFKSLPEPYRVARYGFSKNQLAMTFDDGPDPEWTPKILDVLNREHVPGTFFLIGIQAEKFSSLTKRIYREGHEIGNHTFTHPDISSIGSGYMKVELNLTERLFASRLGVRAMLFRPPYSVDAEPDTEDEVKPLELTQSMGYITIGNKIDTRDWNDEPALSPKQIAARVLDHLPPCQPNDTQCGNIILMHDGGGNRERTVLALPLIIDGARARGFQFVPVYQLMGKTKADVMPPLPANEYWSARLNWIGFWFFSATMTGITVIFFLGDILMTGRLISVGVLAFYDRLHSHVYGTPEQIAAYWPQVAVLIPAYNEEKVIERTVQGALDSDYPNLRVIVIDDGSKDRTLEIARWAFAAEEAAGRVLILTKPNGGKAEALNFGLEHIRDAEVFVGIDADTIVAPDAISRLVPHFLNPKVAAVAGNAKVGNRVNLWTRWQALEYITSQNFERRALNTMGAVSVVPGAIGAWRTTAVREAGGYHVDTVAEDADLTMALLRNGYRVEYEDRALAFTEAPTSANALMRQRFRWSFGILQAIFKHKGVFARKGALGFVALPNILIFQILLPLVSPFIDLMFAVGVIWYFVQKHFHPDTTDPGSFQRLLIFFVAFLVIDFLASAIAFALERRQPEAREDAWLLSQVWLQRFAYRQVFSLVLFRTLKRAIQGRPFAWDKLDRTAAVKYVPAERRDAVKVQ
ncbi:MAG: glycosyltransferase [Terriglobales bacterium]|jgi:cellulose synthase/poly-beta-1,6-N-acetylglucosamine synthase-like glycosyltransferase/spore germination protein YaaH/peptidoglycan/xylan/chitin deacetylase (PgdA/CDA1 family)